MKDITAYIEMVRRHDRGLRMLAFRLLDDRTDMDDVMQEAYLKAFRAYPAFRGEADARTWLYRIVYNACLDHLRRARHRRDVALETGEEGGGENDAAVRVEAAFRGAGDPGETVARNADLAAALAALPADHRAAVLLVDAAGFSYEEAADVLGVRPGTVGSRLNAARHALRRSLSPDGCSNEGGDRDHD